jgi:hypothetical protein
MRWWAAFGSEGVVVVFYGGNEIGGLERICLGSADYQHVTILFRNRNTKYGYAIQVLVCSLRVDLAAAAVSGASWWKG